MLDFISNIWFLVVIGVVVLVAFIAIFVVPRAFMAILIVVATIAAMFMLFGILTATDAIDTNDDNASAKTADKTDQPGATPTQSASAATANQSQQSSTGQSTTSVNGAANNAPNNVKAWQVPAHAADLNSEYDAQSNPTGFTKVEIDNAQRDVWNHRVFNQKLFQAPNWDGADSWFNTLALGPNSGGFWTSFGNPGEVIYRGNTNRISWCLADLTTSKWNNIDLKAQFLSRGNPSLPVAMNVRITPNSVVSVMTNGGKSFSQATSDGGDITIILPDNGVTSVCVDYTTAAPTHESHVWFGPYDRSTDINTVDAR